MHNVFPPDSTAQPEVSFDAFLQIDIRVGTVIEAVPYPQARKPSYRMRVDFGPGVGIKKSCAQLTELYDPEDLVGRQVAGVVNFPPRQIGKAISETLILGFPDDDGRIVLFRPDVAVPNGARLV